MAIRAKNRLFQGDIGNNNTQGKAMSDVNYEFRIWVWIPNLEDD